MLPSIVLDVQTPEDAKEKYKISTNFTVPSLRFFNPLNLIKNMKDSIKFFFKQSICCFDIGNKTTEIKILQVLSKSSILTCVD